MKTNMKSIFILVVAICTQKLLLGQEFDSTTTLGYEYNISADIYRMQIDSALIDYISNVGMGIDEPQVSIVYMPTCSCLTLQNDKWYLPKDTLAYSGKCVVMSNSAPKDRVHFSGSCADCSYGLGLKDSELVERTLHKPQENDHLGYVKIISNYTGGMRDGYRTYFDENGKIIRIEYYHKGKLEETEYY